MRDAFELQEVAKLMVPHRYPNSRRTAGQLFRLQQLDEGILAIEDGAARVQGCGSGI